jgi:PAS domain S-box-containing protein
MGGDVTRPPADPGDVRETTASSETAIIALDREGRITRWSEGACRMFGWTEAEMLGGDIARLLPAGAEAIADGLAAALAQGGSRGIRHYRRRSGEIFPASDEIATLHDTAGRAVAFILVLGDRTAERDAVEALRETEERLSRAQRAGKVGMFSIAIAADTIAATAEFCRIFGVPEEAELPASLPESLVVPEDRERISHRDNRVDGSAAVDTEYRIRRPNDGEIRWIARRGDIERDARGEPVRFVGIVQDVTEQRLAQIATQESAAQFAALAQAMPSQVWTAQADGAMQWVNDRFLTYCGVAEQALVEQGWESCVHPDDHDHAHPHWLRAMATGGNYEIEVRMRRHDGVYRWHLVRAVALRDSAGTVLRWIGTCVDIEDQRMAREALADLNRELERRMARSSADRDRLWHFATDILIVMGINGRIEAVNPAWTRILGWAEAEIVGVGLISLIHPDDHARAREELGPLYAGQPTGGLEIRMRHRDGSYRFISWTAVPDAGQIHAVGRDTTESRDLEDRLRQSQKMEAVGQLTGGIAHDFNNLLTGIVGSLEMIERRVGQGRIAELGRYTGIAMDSANRAAALTQRLLAFSRRQSLAPRAVDVDALIDGMTDLLRRSIGEAIRLDHVAIPGLWPTRCDPSQLENAILNLAINARDAMPDGGTLRISAANYRAQAVAAAQDRGIPVGDHVCIAVTDSGTGMSPDVIERAFEPFFTTKPIGQGTGLGLSMIYGFVRQSNGAVTIDSLVGEGTTVRVYLPRHAGQPETPPPEAIAVLGEAHHAPGAETVLVVEDEDAVRGLIVDVLTDLGYRPIEAVDGPSGLEIIRSPATIDLMVTDVGLPGLNGRQLADAARILRPALRILFVTGYAHSAVTREDFPGPGMELITKPFAVEALATRIRAMITAPALA